MFVPIALVVLLAGGERAVEAASVTGEVDRTTLSVGDTLIVTVVGRWRQGEPPLMGANVEFEGEWERGGQSVLSPVQVGDSIQKVWHFQLIASQPDTYRMTPVCFAGGEPTLGSTGEEIRGQPMTVAVAPIAKRPAWLWLLGGAALLVLVVGLVMRTVRARRTFAYKRPEVPPLDEALLMLESIRHNRREDRSLQYLVDVERVIHGYVSRRLNRAISGLTAPQIGESVAEHSQDPEIPEALTRLLRRCGESKFSGQRIDFDALLGLEEQTRSVLERLDQTWV